jgi:DUF971 family protein
VTERVPTGITLPPEIARDGDRVLRRAQLPAAVRVPARVFAFRRGARARPGQEVLQVGKRAVEIRALEPVGSYAVQPQFSDGHSTGIFSWDYLYELGENQEKYWSQYLEKLAAAGASRE